MTTLRDVLFPAESTGSLLGETGIASFVTRAENQPFPATSLPAAAKSTGPGPGIRQVQAAVGALREASIVSVEAVQQWRRIKAGQREELCGIGRDGSGLEKSTSRSNRGEAESEGTAPEAQIDRVSAGLLGNPNSGGTEKHLPAVSPRAGINMAAAQLRGIDRDTHAALPTFWWIPPCTAPHSPAKDAGHRLELGSAPNGAERADGDLTTGAKISLSSTTASTQHRTENPGKGTAVVGITAPASSDTSGAEITPDDNRGFAQASTTFHVGLNYLAKMACDTDFTGAPGSALVDFFPPDTKLYRNPFLLAHNLDDMLTVCNNTSTAHAPTEPSTRGEGETDRLNGSGGGRGPGAGKHSGSSGGEDTRRRTGARIDTERMRSAAVIVLVEEVKEKARKANNAMLDFGGEEKNNQELRRSSWGDPDFSSVGGATNEARWGSLESRQRLDDDQLDGEDDDDPEQARGTPPRSSSAGTKGGKKRNKPKAGSNRWEHEAGGGGGGGSDEGEPETGVEPAVMFGLHVHGTDKI